MILDTRTDRARDDEQVWLAPHAVSRFRFLDDDDEVTVIRRSKSRSRRVDEDDDERTIVRVRPARSGRGA